MNIRIKFSIILVVLGLFTAFLPQANNEARHLKPNRLHAEILQNTHSFTVDEVAKFIVSEDSTIQLIDLRTPEEFIRCNIPGAINIPYPQILSQDYEGYLNQDAIRNIFYSNGDLLSGQAWMITRQIGYTNNFVMNGGMNEWFDIVLNSEFSGERITAKENTLFETRYKARRFFNQMNSLPDSLKTAFLETKRKKEMELVGGCE